MSYIGSKPADAVLTSDDITDGVVTTEKIADGTIGLVDLSATGTKDATTFLRGDNTFQTVSSYTDSDALSLFNASGSPPVYACRAWVNFDGTGTPSIKDSGNVSSITDVNTGQYTVNFTTAMQDANYSCVGGQNNEIVRVGSLTTTTVFVRSENENGTNEDTNYFGVAVFR